MNDEDLALPGNAVDLLRDAQWYADQKRLYDIYRRNIQQLKERIASYAGDAPIELHNRLAEEEQRISPIRDVLREPTSKEAMDRLGVTGQSLVMLARISRVEERLLASEARAEQDARDRAERQKQVDERAAQEAHERAERQKQLDERDAKRQRKLNYVLGGMVFIGCVLSLVAIFLGIVVVRLY